MCSHSREKVSSSSPHRLAEAKRMEGKFTHTPRLPELSVMHGVLGDLSQWQFLLSCSLGYLDLEEVGSRDGLERLFVREVHSFIMGYGKASTGPLPAH